MKNTHYRIDGVTYSEKIGNLDQLDKILENAVMEHEKEWPEHFRNVVALLRKSPKLIARAEGWGDHTFLFIRPEDSIPLEIVPKIKTIPEGAKNQIQKLGEPPVFDESFFMYCHGAMHPASLPDILNLTFSVIEG